MSAYWTSGRVLLREISLEAEMVNLSPLRIGSGREPPLGSLVDLAVIKIRREGRQESYVPGSSLKGLFRSHAEPLVRQKNPRAEPCSGLSEATCMDTKRVEGGATLLNAIKNKLRSNNGKEAMGLFFQNACLLCKIFGAPSYAGRVSFSDAYLLGEARYGFRTGIAIDRRTGAVSKGALYQVEYIEPGARFTFSLRARNVPNYAFGLLARLVGMLKGGELRVGGFKTRGFGLVTLENPVLRYRDYAGKGSNLEQLEPGVDRSVSLEDIAALEDGWRVIKDEKAWEALRRFEEVWNSVSLG